MIILSLFDGISCGRVALERTGIPITKYYAAEIDKHATAISQHNYPDIIRLGDVTKWNSWNVPKPDIILAGSPCVGFSNAGKMSGFNGVSGTMYHYFLDIWKHYQPQYFLLENVKMKKVWQDCISQDLGVDPILINSSKLSAQHRERIYFTNISGVQQPTDKKEFLKDILYSHPNFKLFVQYTNKHKLHYVGGTIQCNQSFDKPKRLYNINNGRQGYRIYSIDGKSITLVANGGGLGRNSGLYWTTTGAANSAGARRLSVPECERLQTLPAGYCNAPGVSDRQKYKALGNGWTVDVISHILSYI